MNKKHITYNILGDWAYYTIGEEKPNKLTIHISTKANPREREDYHVQAFFYKESVHNVNSAYIFKVDVDGNVNFREDCEVERKNGYKSEVWLYLTREEFQAFLEACVRFVEETNKKLAEIIEENRRYKQLYETIRFGVITNHDSFQKAISSFTDEELANEFRWKTSNYVNVIAEVLRLRPGVFEIYEREAVWLDARVRLKGIDYLIEHQHECDTETFAVIVYKFAEPKDLPLIKTLPEEVRKRLVKLIEYHRECDDPYTWLWEVADELLVTNNLMEVKGD